LSEALFPFFRAKRVLKKPMMIALPCHAAGRHQKKDSRYFDRVHFQKGHLRAFKDEIFAFRSEMKSTSNRGARKKENQALKYRIKNTQGKT
jgi:hypothetical protein